MQDTTALLLSVPASGVRSVKIPYTYPGQSLEVQVNASYVGTAGAAAADILTVTSVGGVGKTFGGIIGGIPFTYNSVVGDTTIAIVATSLTAFLKTIPAIAGQVTPVAGATTVTCTANVVGAAGNAINASFVGGGGATASFASAFLTGGSNSTVSTVSGVSVSFMVTLDGVNYIPSNALTVVGVTGAGSNVIGQVSQGFHINDPYRVDAGQILGLIATITNLDATYPAIVSVLTEKTA